MQSPFRRFYVQGDLPVNIGYNEKGQKCLFWKMDIAKLDFHYFVPLFFDGLSERDYPCSYLAFQGVCDLLLKGGDKILTVIPQLIMPIKRALVSQDPQIVCSVIKALQLLLICCEGAGEALVPYYRQILPTFNRCVTFNSNIGDVIEYNQRKNENIGDLTGETLNLLEYYGGENAYINIKYMVPVYESIQLN